MPSPRQLSPEEKRLLHRQQTAALHAVYKQASVNGSQFRLADGSIKNIVTQVPVNPKLLTQCKHCGRSIERRTSAVRPRLFCDRSCSAAHRVRKLKAMAGKAGARAHQHTPPAKAPANPSLAGRSKQPPRTRTKGRVYARRKKKPTRLDRVSVPSSTGPAGHCNRGP
jgi:hypothetical protein